MLRPKSLRFSLLLLIVTFCATAFVPAAHAASPTVQAGLLSSQSGLCVAVPGAASTTGLVLAQASCTSTSQAYFAFLAQSDGSYLIEAPESSALCVDLNDSGQLVQNYCLPTASQHWIGSFHADGTVTIINQQTGQCIGATAAASGVAAGFAGVDCSATAAQQFTMLSAQYYTPPVIAPAAVLPSTPATPTVGQWQAGMFQGMPYRILFPTGYDPVHHYYPLALFLHGEGERGTDNQLQLVNGMSSLPNDMDFRANVPMIVVAPQCPVTDTWGQANMPNPSASEALAVQLVQTLVGSLAVDPQRVSVTGLSMGGLGAWDVINRYPAIFAAAAPIAGAGNVADVPNLVWMPIYAVHGSADGVVPPIYDETMYADIHALGGPMLYFEIAGGGHDDSIWDPIYAMTSFWQWMYSQQHI